VLGCFLFALAAVPNPLGAQAAGAQEPTLRLAKPIRPDTLRGEWRTIQIPANDFQPVKADRMQLRGASFQISLAPATSTSSDTFVPIMTTFAGGSGDGAAARDSTFSQPYDAALAPDGTIAIVDTYNNRIRKIDPQTRIVTTIAGSGDEGYAGDGASATNASMNFPLMAAYGTDGALHFTDTWNDRVRRVDPISGTINTAAGNGPNSEGDCLASNGAVGAGTDGDGGMATLAIVCGPSGVAVDANNNIYIAETQENRIRRVDAITSFITTVAGSGSPVPTGDGSPATSVAIVHPWGIAIDLLGNPIVSDDDGQYRVRYINLLDHPVTIYPGGPQPLTVQPNSVLT